MFGIAKPTKDLNFFIFYDNYYVLSLMWDGNRLLNENRDLITQTYIYEQFGFTPVASLDDKNSINYYHTDHLGTPRELTDEKGEIVWEAEYDTWGNIKESSKSNDGIILVQPLRFQGQYYDGETGLHYNRFRYYDPDMGRFVSQDPIGLLGGDNLYQYAMNPVGWIDPFGLADDDCLSRKSASNQAKKDAKIPKSQQPEKVEKVEMTDSNNKTILDDNHQPITTREYHYKNTDGDKLVIQDHSAGHDFGEGGVGNQGSHINVRPSSNTRTGKVPGTKPHYNFKK